MTEPIPRDLLTGIQYRAATIEALDDEERIITMQAVPYDVEVRVDRNVYESFAPGAFARARKDPPRCTLYDRHSVDGGRPVGNAVEIDEKPGGLWLSTKVSKTVAGDELLTLVRDGVLDEASVEFNPITDGAGKMTWTRRGDDVVVRHRRAVLRGVAIVPHGAYGRNALVASVRDDREKAREAAIAHLQALSG